MQVTSLLAKIRAGYFFGEASALKQVRKTKLPMLFIHGGADTFVPTSMVYELLENGPRHKQLFIVPGAGHGLARRVDREGYDREVAGFVSRYVK
ncbi:serine aminopeptidase domain-containing protein [Paenibacillus sp. y28]|uniref:serine aminopeptidase domain-containing protein n=1 Tax=Paenibacillus sp. y28 TaxID=3129110 RepID=UPI00301AFC4B